MIIKDHQLVKKNNRWHCSLCDRSWQGKPRARCPGVRVVKMSKKELDGKKKQNDSSSVLPSDSVYFIRRNLKPLSKVACIKQGKSYIYLYDPNGETEKIDPNLPPVVLPGDCDRVVKRADSTHCLKSEIALKRLNLCYEGIEPTAVYYYWGKFYPLYNPLDCSIRIQNFPQKILGYWDYRDLTKEGKFLATRDRESLNLKPKDTETAYAAYWNDGDWDLLFEKEQCEIADTSLPPCIFKDSDDFGFDLKSDRDLPHLNLKPRQNMQPIGCYIEIGGESVLVWDIKQCEQIDTTLPMAVEKISPHWVKAEELKRFNRLPTQSVAAIYRGGKFVLLYEPKNCAIADNSLPPLYDRLPIHLYKKEELVSRNLKPTIPKGMIWSDWKQDFRYLYDLADCEIDDLSLPPVIPHEGDFDRNRDLNWQYIPVGSALKSKLGLKRLNLTSGNAEPVAVCWNHRRFDPLYNPLDCQIAIVDLPPVVDRQGDLLDKEYLKKLNLQPRQSQLAIATLWDFNKEDWAYLFDIKQCEQIDTTLPPVYFEQPDWLYKKSELAALNRKLGSKTKPVVLLKEYTQKFYLYDPAECKIINKTLPPVFDRDRIPEELKSEWAWRASEPLFELKPNAIATGCFIDKFSTPEVVLLYKFDQLKLHELDVQISKTKLRQNYKFSQAWLERLGTPDEIKYFRLSDGTRVESHLYWRSRIERFLAENSDEYIKFLSRKRKQPLVFYAIDSPKNLTKEIEERLKNIDLNTKQKKMCLTCSYGAVIPKGFLCTVFPLGIRSIPCHEWQPKN